MGKNVAVFVDVANIFYAAKAAGVDIDYVTLLKASSAGRDLVRAYAYTGLDPDNENQRNFHDFLRRVGYRVVSKDIRKYGDGKVKANLDIELVVDMMKTARNLDVAIVVSGDGDFAPAIRAVQEQGVRVEVVSFRGNTSSDLMDVADLFTDIIQIAKVEKGSARSGRRVAGDEQDLSMTEVPDKQSEGTGERGRGRGRGRRTTTPVTLSAGRGRSRVAVPVSDGGEGTLVALPGEKLSRAAAAPAGEATAADLDEVIEDLETGEPMPAGAGSDEERLEDGRRRRRRRGGRGRGRGRREEGTFVEGAEIADGGPVEGPESDDEDEEEAPAVARRPASTFGSVWDSQIGIPAASRGAPVVDEDEDFEEPSVPEYLLTERRQRDAGRGQGGGGRGRGGAYAAALNRERFGGGRGSTPSRFQEPPPRQREGGPRDAGRGPGRPDRPPFRPAPRPAPRPSGDEPWSEVPPEIEAMLRAQLGSRPPAEGRREAPARTQPRALVDEAPAAEAPMASGVAEAPASGRRSSGRTTASAAKGTTRGGRRTGVSKASTDEPTAAAAGSAEPAAEKPTARSRSTRSTKAAATTGTGDEGATEAPAASKAKASGSSAGAARAGTSTRGRSRSAASAEGAAADGDVGAKPAPKRRTTRSKAEPAA